MKEGIIEIIELKIRKFLASPSKELYESLCLDFTALETLLDNGIPCRHTAKGCSKCRFQVTYAGPRGGERRRCWMRWEFSDDIQEFYGLNLAQAHLFLSERLYIFEDWENRKK